MAQVTLNQVAIKVELEPKVIRRILRKNDIQKPYIFDDTNPTYDKVIRLCKEYKRQAAQPKKPKKERIHERIVWDGRGLTVIEGNYWMLVMIPHTKDPDILEATSVWLGKVEDVKAIITGEKPIPTECSNYQRLAFSELRERGKK